MEEQREEARRALIAHVLANSTDTDYNGAEYRAAQVPVQGPWLASVPKHIPGRRTCLGTAPACMRSKPCKSTQRSVLMLASGRCLACMGGCVALFSGGNRAVSNACLMHARRRSPA